MVPATGLAQAQLSAKITTETMLIDGRANEATWASAEWRTINIPWIGSLPNPADCSGRYKLAWDANYLYLLAEITDDVVIDTHALWSDNYWNDDCLELFLDENRSGGDLGNNYNAFAYHISLSGDVVAGGPGGTQRYNDNIAVARFDNGNVHTWELRIKVANESNVPVALTPGKLIGFTLAYNDTDMLSNSTRETMLCSGDVPVPNSKSQTDKNVGYLTANYYQELTLVDPNAPTPIKLEAENWTGMSGVQTEQTGDTGGGLDVGWTHPGDYIDYAISVPTSGTYRVDCRVASTVATGKFELKSGSTVLATVNVPNTYGWQAWQTVPVTISNLTTEIHSLRLSVVSGDFNINWMTFTSTFTPALTTISVTPNPAIVANGSTQQFAAQGYDQRGGVMAGTYVWATTGGGTINQSGLFTATTEGNGYRVTATSGAISGSSTVSVTFVPALTTVVVTPNPVSVANGGTQQFAAQGYDQRGGAMAASYVWATTGGGTINQSGLFTATTEGNGYRVTATSGAISGSSTVSVTFVPVLTTVVVTPDPATVANGRTQQFAAQGYDQRGGVMAANYVWTATGGGTVNQSGLFTATTEGNGYRVSATSGAFSGSSTVSVTPAIVSFTDWAALKFSAAELLDPAISGPYSDPDGVGATNFLRYALDLPARGPVTLPAATVVPYNGLNYLTLAYTRRSSGGDLSYIVESSTNLVNWTVLSTEVPGPTREVIVRSEPALSADPAPRRFMRLRVE
jgi:hypothetical protein